MTTTMTMTMTMTITITISLAMTILIYDNNYCYYRLCIYSINSYLDVCSTRSKKRVERRDRVVQGLRLHMGGINTYKYILCISFISEQLYCWIKWCSSSHRKYSTSSKAIDKRAGGII